MLINIFWIKYLSVTDWVNKRGGVRNNGMNLDYDSHPTENVWLVGL